MPKTKTERMDWHLRQVHGLRDPERGILTPEAKTDLHALDHTNTLDRTWEHSVGDVFLYVGEECDHAVDNPRCEHYS